MKEILSTLPWYRGETNADGTVSSLEQVESGNKNGKNVWYVQAASKAQAGDAIKALWLARYERCRAENSKSEARLYAERTKRNLCVKCGAPPRLGKTLCESCREKNLARVNKRNRLKRAGLYVPPAPALPEEKIARTMKAYANRADWHRRSPLNATQLISLRMLKKFLTLLRSCKTIAQLEGKVLSQIYELENKNRHEKNPQAAE